MWCHSPVVSAPTSPPLNGRRRLERRAADEVGDGVDHCEILGALRRFSKIMLSSVCNHICHGKVTTCASTPRPAHTRECWPGGASAMAHLLAYARAIRETTAGTFLATPASSTASKTMMHPEILATDLAFGESPRWHGDRLW